MIDLDTHRLGKEYKILLETWAAGQTGLPRWQAHSGLIVPGREVCRAHPAQNQGTLTFGEVSENAKIQSHAEIKP